MNIQITPNRLSVYIVILIISLNCTGVENLKGSTTVGFQPVDANQIPQILLMISAKVRNNYEKINTWQGEAGITTERIYEGEEAERIFNTYTDGIGKAPKILKKRREHASKFFIDTRIRLNIGILKLGRTLARNQDRGMKHQFLRLNIIYIVIRMHFVKALLYAI